MSAPVISEKPTDTTVSLATIFLMATACACAVSTIYYNQPLLPEMGASFGRTAAQAGVIATWTQLGYAGGLLLFVPLGDRMDRRKLILTLLTLNTFGLLALACSSSFSMLLMTSAAVGLTAVTSQIVIPAISGLAPPETRGRAIGSLLSGLSAGLLFSRTVSGFVGAHAGWRVMFFIAVGINIILMLIILLRFPKIVTTSKDPYPVLLKSLWVLIWHEPVLRAASITGAGVGALMVEHFGWPGLATTGIGFTVIALICHQITTRHQKA